jgi:hypothetical protein
MVATKKPAKLSRRNSSIQLHPRIPRLMPSMLSGNSRLIGRSGVRLEWLFRVKRTRTKSEHQRQAGATEHLRNSVFRLLSPRPDCLPPKSKAACRFEPTGWSGLWGKSWPLRLRAAALQRARRTNEASQTTLARKSAAGTSLPVFDFSESCSSSVFCHSGDRKGGRDQNELVAPSGFTER